MRRFHLHVFFSCVLIIVTATGCISTHSEIEVKPVQVTVDVNIRVKVDKELEDVFGDLDSTMAELEEGAE